MCTVTVLRTCDDVIVTMNRDESRHREDEIPPALHDQQNWMGPLDGKSGGTWFGVSTHGVVACLLNGYDYEVRRNLPAVSPTRGALVPEALKTGSLPDIEKSLKKMTLDSYRSFRIVLADSARTVEYLWNGDELTGTELPGERIVLSSSSWKQKQVMAYRKSMFEEWSARTQNLDSVETLANSIGRDFHHLQPPRKEMSGPLITRDVSITRSITQAILSKKKHASVLSYWASPEANHPEDPERYELQRQNFEPAAKD